VSFRSKTYLDYVRAHECCSCGSGAPSEAHHCAPPGISPAITGKGMSQKADDMWTVPVCKICHTLWHGSSTYRRFRGMSVDQSDHLIAITQLRLMAHWIRMLDPDTDLF
jgi:hypothetical protein